MGMQKPPACINAETKLACFALSPPAASQALDYGVPESNVMGIRYGFRGFTDRQHRPVQLTRR